ncbi:MAG: hypothetical protein RRZ24_11100 [Clostridia bacterium]
MSDYWEDRALERLDHLELISGDYASHIYMVYQNATESFNGSLMICSANTFRTAT